MADPAFRFVRQGGITFCQSTVLGDLDFMLHAFGTRQGGNSTGNFAGLNLSYRQGDEAGQVRANWEALALAFDIAPEQFLTVRQVHGDDVLTIDDSRLIPERDAGGPGEEREPPLCFDAIITNQPGLAIGIKTADCVPILLVDPVRRVIAAVHAGWKGTARRIVSRVCDILRRRFACRMEDLNVAIGPAIGPCCYEVDLRVWEAMGGLSERESFFHSPGKGGRWMLDLALANRLQLLDAGVPEAHVQAAHLCTSCRRHLFFSHRGSGGATGRQFNFILLKGDQ